VQSLASPASATYGGDALGVVRSADAPSLARRYGLARAVIFDLRLMIIGVRGEHLQAAEAAARGAWSRRGIPPAHRRPFSRLDTREASPIPPPRRQHSPIRTRRHRQIFESSIVRVEVSGNGTSGFSGAAKSCSGIRAQLYPIPAGVAIAPGGDLIRGRSQATIAFRRVDIDLPLHSHHRRIGRERDSNGDDNPALEAALTAHAGLCHR